MYFIKETYNTDMEILVTEKNLVQFSGTVLASNVTIGDEHGKKYVPIGSLIDEDGNVVKQTGSSGSETLSATPVGILCSTVDVTNGDPISNSSELGNKLIELCAEQKLMN